MRVRRNRQGKFTRVASCLPWAKPARAAGIRVPGPWFVPIAAWEPASGVITSTWLPCGQGSRLARSAPGNLRRPSNYLPGPRPVPVVSGPVRRTARAPRRSHSPRQGRRFRRTHATTSVIRFSMKFAWRFRSTKHSSIKCAASPRPVSHDFARFADAGSDEKHEVVSEGRGRWCKCEFPACDSPWRHSSRTRPSLPNR